MIISRAPFRVSFVGGGTDLPQFYSKHGGAVVSTAIAKYVRIAVNKLDYEKHYRVRYSKTEIVNSIDKIQHPIVREAIKLVGCTDFLDVSCMSDIPSRSGLGSSSAFTVAMLDAAFQTMELAHWKEFVARQACLLEMDILDGACGKQDQYASAFGKMNVIRFGKDGSVELEEIREAQAKSFLDYCWLLYLGRREIDSKRILLEQGHNTAGSKKVQSSLLAMKDLAFAFSDCVDSGKILQCAQIINESWQLKKTICNKITSPLVEEVIDTAMKNGAFGGKLLGAGGSGFVLLIIPVGHEKKIQEIFPNYPMLKVEMDTCGVKTFYDV